MKTEKILVMINGDRHTITGEQGKYWICGDTGFRKLSKQIASVEEVEIPDAEVAAETDAEPGAEPKKKPASRKKKKAEPSEEEQKEGE